VPSPPHEILVELFRNCWALAPELLALCADIAYRHDHLERTSIDLSQVVSTEYRADSVVELRDRDDAAVAAVIVEVQLGVDAHKKYSWPVYVTTLRAKLQCPVVLLVLAPERAVARWAEQPIDLGHPGFRLEPVVISFDRVPRIQDAAHAQRLPELAVLSAMAHPELEVVETALAAIGPLRGDLNQLYFDVILANLPEALRQIMLETRNMQGYQYRSEFARKYYNQGREEGIEKGREEGIEKGREEGLRAAVLRLARGRLASITPEDVAAIEAMHDEHTLTELIDALASAGSGTDVRAALDRVIGNRHSK
jgi:hypothetical protein